MARAAQTFKSVINEMTYGSDIKLNNMLHTDNANFTQEDLNTSIDEPENGCTIHLVSYDTVTSRAKPPSNGQLSYCACSVAFLMSPIGTRLKSVWAGKSR